MSAKTILVFCAQALLVKSAFSQCLGRAGIVPGLAPGIGPGLAPGFAGSYGVGYGCGGVASTGGGFQVSSYSPLPPSGLSVRSENAIEGTLSVGGEVPFLGTVALEGILPTAGAGAISYGCGNGAVGITSEGPITTGITTAGTYGPGIAGPAFGPGLAGPAFGSGLTGPGLAVPAFGPGLAVPAFESAVAGPLYGPALGYNGLSIGCGGL